MKKMLMCLIFLLVGMFGTQAWAIQIPILYFDSFISSVSIGDSFDIDARISWLDCDTDVGAFDINVNFDDSILAFDSYSLTDNLGSLSKFEADDWSLGDTGNGSVNLAELSYLTDLSFQDDSFKLATLSFTGIGVGTSLLSFGNSYISDAWGADIFALKGLAFAKVKEGPAPVPEPATILLFGTGLAGFSIRLRKKRKVQD